MSKLERGGTVSLALALAVVASAGTTIGFGASPKSVPAGQPLADSRLAPLKDLNGYFPFKVPDSREEWAARSSEVRERILVSQGLWPMPTKTALNPVIHGKVSMGDYSVEKVYFESFPGYFVTGNLYRPVGRAGKFPGILCPHGHWAEGRFTDNNDILNEIVAGGERFENGGRSPLQSRCVQLARMGCVVFHYDMVGYADCTQISYELAHRFAKQRPHMNRAQGWGFFSPQAESHLQSIMGLQSWNSVRALDFIESLPDVDPGRLAMTGASGGGTQTFLLSAVDPRLAVSFPAVMVSTAMQGGCTCENASLLRVGTGNVEFAGLFAPKPLGLTGADDWTVEMKTKGFPELKALYQLLGHEDRVQLTALNHFGHNYNYVSRAAMYRWMNRHLGLGLKEPIVEQDYPRLTREDLTVWNKSHPEPKGGDDFERELLEYWHDDISAKVEAAAGSRADFVRLAGPALKTIVGRSHDSSGELEWVINEKNDRQDHLEMSGLLKNRTYQEEVPVVFLYPRDWKGTSVLWLSADGKDGLYAPNGRLLPAVQELLSNGVTVLGADLHLQGESALSGGSAGKTRSVANPREAAAYTFGYNSSVFAKRVHDVLSIVKFLNTHEEKSEQIGLIALGKAGAWGAVARALLGDSVQRYAIDTDGFRFGNVTDLHSPDFLPGGAKYLDLVGFLLAGEPTSLWLAGEPAASQQRIRHAYAQSAGSGSLAINVATDTKTLRASAVDWIRR